MKIIVSAAASLAIAATAAGAAQAGPASDTFGTCLVQSSTGKDRIVFVQWMFAALAANPNVASMANVSPERRAELSRQGAEVMQRLILKDCHAEAVAAIRQDGEQAITASFQLFGQAAARELMSDPAVEKEMSGLDAYLDRARWNALIEEAKPK
jgi:hypothetical protein